MSSLSFTSALLSSPDTAELFERATRAGFLELAGQGRLPREQLSQWLAQDRLYCQAYARFIGGLISRVRLPQQLAKKKKHTADTLEWRILSMLHGALGSMMAELQLFETTADAYGLDLQAVGPEVERRPAGFGPGRTTRGYIELFDSFTAAAAGPGAREGGRSLLEGLVVLWVTEKAYLEAWSYARRQQPRNPDPKDDLDGGALRKHFIDNWTSDEFKAFVKEIEGCLDALAAAQDGDTGEVLLASSLSVVKKVLVLEEEFWPMVA